ncbi:MAG: chemotaxis response regulator protein-glutamate methylesterase of group 1 operon [Gammaproteobacteria bacterium]|nr:MAG: chemotaxis response regulator protein-glutamate methylesterase of group 1 operon [Gammaproteobacteria bacterium]
MAEKPEGLSVLVVDDSRAMRELLRAMLVTDERIARVDAAGDAEEARAAIVRRRPDVVLLDIELPAVDGIRFLRELMACAPFPVLIVSGVTNGQDERAVDALRAGALDVIPKSEAGADLVGFRARLLAKVHGAARARPRAVSPATTSVTAAPIPAAARPSRQVIAIGASAGGPAAVETLLAGLRSDLPAMVVALHLPARLTAAFARRLDERSSLRVREARDGDRLCFGEVLVAPGGQHIEIARSRRGFRVVLSPAAPGELLKPCIDRLFESVAACAGPDAMGILLTGMGDDGARGLLRMRQAGAMTVAEDESSCAVFGMPRAAQALNAARHVLPLPKIGRAILAYARLPDVE